MYNIIGISVYVPSLLLQHYFLLGTFTEPMVLRTFLSQKKQKQKQKTTFIQSLEG